MCVFCTYVVYIRTYICRFCQCWHERVRICTYIIIHMNVVMHVMWLHCCYKADKPVCTDVCKNIRLYVHMFVHLHLLAFNVHITT